MKTFRYVGFDRGGRATSGLIEAFHEKEARERLHARGILVQSLRIAGAEPIRPKALADRAAIYAELAALLTAGLPLTQALQVLLETPETAGHQTWLAEIRDRVREGVSFAEALGARPGVQPLEKTAVAVGERTGTLALVLDRLGRFLAEQSRIRERVETALLYPAMVVVVAVLIALLTSGVLLPRMVRLWEEAGIALPRVTRVFLAVGRWGGYGIPSILIGVLGLVLVDRHLRNTSGEWRMKRDRFLFRCPILGPAWAALVGLRFARTMALLLQGGVPLVEALPLAAEATGSPWTALLVREQAENVRHGEPVAEALRRVPPLSGALPVWVQAGEASGQMAELLEQAARSFQDRWERSVGRSLALLEPILVIGVGLLVLFIALATLLPILTLHRMVGSPL